MTNADLIQAALVEHRIDLAGPIVGNPDQPNGYVVFVRVQTDKNGKKTPSPRKLSLISAGLKSKGIDISWITILNKKIDVDASIKAYLFMNFSSFVRNSYVNIVGESALIWIDVRGEVSEHERNALKNGLAGHVEAFKIRELKISYVGEENTPTNTLIMRIIRKLSPCRGGDVLMELNALGFVNLNTTWLSHALDRLRRSGLLMRSKTGNYYLSHSGISKLGTAKNAKSPDVARALALARRTS